MEATILSRNITASVRSFLFRGFEHFKIAGVILVIAVCASEVSAESWNGIQPLKSRRVDVEGILGKCLDKGSTSGCKYTLDDKNILIEYSAGTACTTTGPIWNVPSETVLRITIHQTNGGILLKNLPYDLKAFRREEDPELPGLEHYTKDNEGLSLAVESGFVLSWYFDPQLSDREKFACHDRSKRGH